jgi:uracil-DNA glycosylase
MAVDFDPGYGQSPFDQLCREYPGTDIYPASDFRTEWGPVFHRGRLDGSARVLLIGQDPAQHEEMARRILIGTAGHRIQGFLAKLGFVRSYVMVNTFLFSVYGQAGGERHQADPGITEYRNRWLDALLVGSQIEAVIALGSLANGSWKSWKSTASGAGFQGAYAHITHPTEPEGASKGNHQKLEAGIAAMLKNWNSALQVLGPAIAHPDLPRPMVLYGHAFGPGDYVAIPDFDLPAGSPAWMLGREPWATRTGATAIKKRYSITITVPADFQKK